MIIGPSFVWLHFPKTAGHTVDLAIRAAAKRMAGVSFDNRGRYHPGWHDVLSERAERDPSFDPSGKVVISGFRRLPYWLLSRAHYEASQPPFRVATRELILKGRFFEADGSVGHADRYAERYRRDARRWVRTEHLIWDFERGFADILDPKALRLACGRLEEIRNRSEFGYLARLEFYFTRQELADIYNANPIWSGLEESLYGGLITL